MVSLQSQYQVIAARDSPYHSKNDGRQQVEASLRLSIRGEGDGQCKCRCEQVRRGCQEEGVDFRHAECGNDRRDKLSDSSSRGFGDDNQCQQIELVVSGGRSEALEQRHGFFVPDAGILFESVDRDGLFPQAEPTGAIGRGLRERIALCA